MCKTCNDLQYVHPSEGETGVVVACPDCAESKKVCKCGRWGVMRQEYAPDCPVHSS